MPIILLNNADGHIKNIFLEEYKQRGASKQTIEYAISIHSKLHRLHLKYSQVEVVIQYEFLVVTTSASSVQRSASDTAYTYHYPLQPSHIHTRRRASCVEK